MAGDLYQNYQSQAISQADPVKLVAMLYEGAIRFTNRASKAITDGDMEGAHNNILRAYAIISELMATLDFERGGEVAVSLEQLYDYVLHLYREADIRKEQTYLDDALRMIEPLLSSWSEAFRDGVPALPEDLTDSQQVKDGKSQEAEPLQPAPEQQHEVKSEQPGIRKPLDLTG